jgi:hypothetical protein
MCTGLNADLISGCNLVRMQRNLTEGEGGSQWDVFFEGAGDLFKTLLSIPGRTDRVLGRIERGELNVQMPMVNIQISYLERSLNRLTGGIIFLALLVSGAILYDTHLMLGQILLGGSGLTLFYTLFLVRRSRRPWQ